MDERNCCDSWAERNPSQRERGEISDTGKTSTAQIIIDRDEIYIDNVGNPRTAGHSISCDWQYDPRYEPASSGVRIGVSAWGPGAERGFSRAVDGQAVSWSLWPPLNRDALDRLIDMLTEARQKAWGGDERERASS